MSDYEIGLVILSLSVLAIVLLLVDIFLEYLIYRKQAEYLDRVEKRDIRIYEMLELMKVWNESAHTQHKDAKRVLEKVEETTATVSGVSGSATAAIEKATNEVKTVVPERTAEMVVEKLKREDGGPPSGIFRN